MKKTKIEYRKEILIDFMSAQEVRGFKSKNKNAAMWELLSEKKIISISPTLWMTTADGKKEIGFKGG